MGLRLALVLLLSSLALCNIDALGAEGRTPGQFNVSANGSAQYSIPIWTPPGIRGIQPSLSLSYDSHLGYGIMGSGWTLGGLSTISRCNLTYAQDGAPAPITLTAADGLCLDGNRLRTAGTGVYQTEIANFSQVTASGTAGNGPSFFTVQGKDGLTYEYGNTTDSRILPCASGCPTPYVWALDKVTDRSGNHMTFTYFQSGGAFVPLSIQYTASSGSTSFPYQINFTYSTLVSPNPNILTRFIASSQIQQTQQLSTITVTSSGTTVREYKLLYTTSSATLRATLISIQECGSSAGTDCLLATTVGYQGGTAGVASPTTASGSGATNGTVYSVDIDGDGKQDLVFAVTSGTNYQWWVQLATATGYGSPISTGASTAGTTGFLLDNFDAQMATEILAPVGASFSAYKWNGTCSPSTGGSSCFTATPTTLSVVTGAKYSSADVDGDGRPDIVHLSNVGSELTAAVQFNTSTAGSISFNSTPTTTPLGGCPFTCTIYGNNELENSPTKHFDFDGDGRQDLIFTGVAGSRGANIYALLSRGSAGFVLGATTGTLPNLSPLMAVNWNDDACTDLVVTQYVFVYPCNGTPESFFPLGANPIAALDWDGDGRSPTYKVVEDYAYDSFGNLHTDTVTGVGMTPRVTTINWTASGQFPQTVSNPLSQSITLGFDPNTGMKTSQTDPNSTTANPLATSWAYDDFGRETSESRPDGTSTSFAYNSCTTGGCVNANNKMTVTTTTRNVGGSTQSVTNTYLDLLDRSIVTSSTMLSGAFDRREVQYDSLGRVHQQGAPCAFVSCANYWTIIEYDALNRPTQVQRPINVTNSGLQTIHYSGRTTTVTDPQGKISTKINLVTGALARSHDHNGYYQGFTYDAFGSLRVVSDNASPSNALFAANYGYGIQAFQTSSTDADLGARSNTYDALGELTAYSDAKGQTFSVTYDTLSRPKVRMEPDLTTTWTWGGTAASFNIGNCKA